MQMIRNKHLLHRAGFGPMSEQLESLQTVSPDAVWKALEISSSKKHTSIDVVDDHIKGLFMGIGEAGKQVRSISDEEKRMLRVKSREGIRNLNTQWLNQMVNSDQQLREKVALFWHGHFASRNLNILYQQQLLEVIRANALGNFSVLLRSVSKSASMIFFLNNNRNVKDHPNENFARELMELFTMGRGHYTEQDVKEAARSFTGWNANLKGEFMFRRFQHDNGSKTVLNKTGNLDGDDVIDIILSNRQTAKFISEKFYRFFVNETPDNEKINWLADRFYKSNYEIMQLVTDVFTSDWFFDQKNIGNKIKSPVELIAGIRRLLPMTISNEDSQIMLQRVLGQVLFYPPNVAGWPGGKNWIDSSSLLFRMKLPRLLASNDLAHYRAKDDDDVMMGNAQEKRNAFAANIHWESFSKSFKNIERKNLIHHIKSSILQNPGSISNDLILKFSDQTSRESFIQSVTLQILSTPEYQLC